MANAMKSKLAVAKAALDRKQADLDAVDDQIMGLDSGIPSDLPATPEFDLLTAKREELEEEIRTMREGVQFISEWEKLKGGQWSEGIRSQLDGLDSEIANIAGGDAAEPGMGVGPDMGAPLGDPLAAPPAPDALAAPAGEVAPETAPAPEIAAPDAAAEPAPEAPAPALEPPMASAKSAVNKKNNYQTSQKRGNSASPEMKKEGSTMATPTATKPSNLKEKLAELKTKRETIKREAQVRTAAAYTIANTMLPGAPVEKRQAFASSLLQGNDTKALVAALRQTAINAHNTHIAEQFKEVHKVELNDLLEDPSVLKSERSAVEKEIKGDAKSAGKTADDRKDAGPQTDTYNDGRGCGGGTHSEPKEMEASKAGDRPDAGEKPGQTVNLSDGKSAASKKAKCKDGEKCAGCDNCKSTSAADKKAAEKCADCKGDKKCAKHASAKAKKADEPPMDAPLDAPAGDAPPMDMAAPAGDAGLDAPPMDAEPPADEAGAILTDEKKMVVQEKIEEVNEAVKALEQEILEENEEEVPLALEEGEPSEEELDLSSVFDQDEMEDKAASLANEGDEHQAAGDDDSFFAPTSAAGMESVLDDSGMQVASIESYFDMQGSDADPLYSLIASEEKVAMNVEGFDVLESFTGEVANKLKQNEAGAEDRDNESDHDEDLFVEAMKDIKPEEQGAKRTPQDAVPQLQSPKSAAAKTAAKAPTGSIKRVRPVVASPKPVDIATALFGDDE
jgi:hypothetical protein